LCSYVRRRASGAATTSTGVAVPSTHGTGRETGPGVITSVANNDRWLQLKAETAIHNLQPLLEMFFFQFHRHVF